MARWQRQKPAVIDHEPKPPGTLTRTPADPELPCLEAQGWRAEGQQRDPLPVHLSHIPQPLSNQLAALQVMLPFEIVVELASFVVADQTNRNPSQNVALGRSI